MHFCRHLLLEAIPPLQQNSLHSPLLKYEPLGIRAVQQPLDPRSSGAPSTQTVADLDDLSYAGNGTGQTRESRTLSAGGRNLRSLKVVSNVPAGGGGGSSRSVPPPVRGAPSVFPNHER